MTRSSTAAPIVAVLAIVLVTLGAYAGGYFWLAVYRIGASPDRRSEKATHFRIYKNELLSRTFVPCSWVESAIRGEPVVATTWEGLKQIYDR